MNELTGKDVFTAVSAEGHEIPAMPLELQKGFSKKRIDHRHHAMDAITIACATRDHVNLLNNEAAHSQKHDKSYRHDLQRKLRRFEKTLINGQEREVAKEFLKPWNSFTTDAKQALENIIVSFKQNLRVINKTTNHYQHFDESGKKVMTKQEGGDSWAIRKSMHKDTVFGEVNLRFKKQVSLNVALENPQRIVDSDFRMSVVKWKKLGMDAKAIKKLVESQKDVWSDIDVKKVWVYYFTKETNDHYFATRKPLDTSFDKKTIETSITDTGIQKILLHHLKAKNNNPELAFSADGIDEMNRNIVALNNGKFHQPILKVRKYEKAEKFAIGQNGNKAAKFVEAAKGTNLFFAVFSFEKLNKETGEVENVRLYLTIPLNVMLDCQKRYGAKWQDYIEVYLKEMGFVSDYVKLLFILSPNDLVYLPTKEELKDGIKAVDKKRIYKMVSCTGNEGHFAPARIANPILQTIELGSNNKAQRAWTGEMIKEICIPLKVDRLGNIIEIGK